MKSHFMLGAVTACAVATLVLTPAKTKAQEMGASKQVSVSVDFVDAPKSVMEKAMKSFPSGHLPSDDGLALTALLACGATQIKGPQLQVSSDASDRVWQEVQDAAPSNVTPPNTDEAAATKIENVTTTSSNGLTNILDASPHINTDGTIMLAFKIKRGVAPDPHFPSSTLSISEAMSDEQFFRRLPMVRTFKDGETENIAMGAPLYALMHHFTFVTVKVVPLVQPGKP